MFAKTLLVPAFLLTLSYTTIAQARTETTVTGSPTSLNDTAAYQGPKARIAVSEFTCKAAKCSQPYNIGRGLADMLTTALVQSGRFIVLESVNGQGSNMKAVMDELEFTQSGYVEEGKGPQTGLMEGADLIITAAITGFDPDASGGAGRVGGSNWNLPVFGNVNLKTQHAYIAADIRIIDVRTRRIVNTTHVEGDARNIAAGGRAGGAIENLFLSGALSGYQNTPMEQAIMIMINDAVNNIASLTPESYYRYSKQ